LVVFDAVAPGGDPKIATEKPTRLTFASADATVNVDL
jgi:hypothetical protein